ncbi:MAG TPA: tRNA (guanosine(46)-N7)-methyltransferase TrmB [Candidatus Aphodousia faecavium]|nr:tRNA (guanosine(46)-N7)-methyltransferase TrmB [Candidatus Aphodousia faecavium]
MTERKILTAEEIEAFKKKHIRSFTLRRGHISQAQKRALEELLPHYAVEYTQNIMNPEEIFERKAPWVLEIGCGMGETTAAIAQMHPEVNFLGCEVFSAGVGALAKRLDEMSLTNVRIIQHDAVEVVKDMIAPDSLDGVHIYFPDPWRKARHHKRRLVAQPFIHELVQRIKPGGYIHCATDWENYAEQMLEVLTGEPLLKNMYEGYSPVMANPITERPMTKFHARGERLGHGVWDLVFKRQ